MGVGVMSAASFSSFFFKNSSTIYTLIEVPEVPQTDIPTLSDLLSDRQNAINIISKQIM